MIAKITGTLDGNTVEDHNDVRRPSIATLLRDGDEITIHTIYDHDQIDDLKRRYHDVWAEKVTIEPDNNDADSTETQ